MEQRNLSDAVLINDMVQKLGISPLDIFMNWITTGEIKNITVSIAYKNGDVVKADLMQSVSQPEEKRHVPELSESEEKVPEMETDSLPPSTRKDDEEEKKPETVSEGVCSCPRETSFTRGTILIKPSQVKNVTVGAYVYTTGDILPLHRALPGVNIRGIILSHSEDRITLLKYVGADFTSFESCAKIKDGWRFLTFQECIKLVKYREKLNIRLAEMKRKQIDNSLLILYQDERKELLGFQVSTRKVKKTLTCKLTAEDRAFALYMAKDLKIV